MSDSINTYPLLDGYALDDIVFRAAHDSESDVTLRQLLHEVEVMARAIKALPEPPAYLLNLHQNRYHFIRGFLAGLLSGSVSLFPSTVTPKVLAQLKQQYPSLMRLGESEQPLEAIPCLDEQTIDFASPLGDDTSTVPAINGAQIAAIVFTSGSTGMPIGYPKRWRDLVQVAKYTAKQLFAANTRAGADSIPSALLATVPSQHMYGLEASCMLPLQHGMTLYAEKPFYPADIANGLKRLAQPTLLVTTPLHLKAVEKTETQLETPTMLLSATAPLSKALAKQSEARQKCPLYEIFGCTEVGTIATRRSARSSYWHTLLDIELSQHGEEEALLNTERLIGEFSFPDRVWVHHEHEFTLLGRKQDMVNIAGKRASLAGLTEIVLGLEGVQDAAYFYPDSQYPDSRANSDKTGANANSTDRLVLFVVAPGLTREALKQSLRECIDAAFLPRKIVKLSALPRNATGKLPRLALEELLAQVAS